jgi:LmbE family N-acetylglucosaminyl deacetylase
MIGLSQLRRIAVIVPHAEDEVIGCGGLLAKAASMEASTYVVFVAVDDLRTRYDGSNASYREQVSEIEAVARLLGFSWQILFDNQGLTHKLDTVPRREMSELFEAIFHDYRPDLLLLPTAEADPDGHRLCSAGLAAAWVGERHTGRWVVPQVMGYEHTALRLAFGTAPRFSAFLDISEQINVKLEALTLYKSRRAPPPDIRSIDSVRALAKLRGAQIDVPYAEALHVFRAVL